MTKQWKTYIYDKHIFHFNFISFYNFLDIIFNFLIFLIIFHKSFVFNFQIFLTLNNAFHLHLMSYFLSSGRFFFWKINKILNDISWLSKIFIAFLFVINLISFSHLLTCNLGSFISNQREKIDISIYKNSLKYLQLSSLFNQSS
jgi:hypothetical protein